MEPATKTSITPTMNRTVLQGLYVLYSLALLYTGPY
jgi:hypothetical protein